MAGQRAILLLVLATRLAGQRAFEASDNVIYEDSRGNRTNLGVGFSPVLTYEGHIALLRGRNLGHGAEFDCNNKQKKNWVSVYDPSTKSEKVLFDQPIPFDGGEGFCIFEQMQLSYDGRILYLVSPVYATSGSLAIVQLARRSIKYVPGVNQVYVIETGPHRDELIYQRRTWRKSASDGLDYPSYPFVHARADGGQIAEISDEYFTVGGDDQVPILRDYLRKIGGQITVSGRKLP